MAKVSREPDDLRSQAEAQVPRQAPLPPPPDDMQALLRELQTQRHELQVHQIELELQNEELRRANEELEELRARYTDLFEQAPVGYLTLDRQGIVQEANLTVCAMLGVRRDLFLRRRFPLFLAQESRSHFSLLLRRVFESPDKRVAELTLERVGGEACQVQVECVLSDAGARGGRTAA